ncbi:MAG: FG-GAP repeat protein [Trueperaceae bacterium]|nr:FG-GAP repeat protein [Trueperaceae bacterium]
MSENILVAGVSHQAIDLDQNGFLSSNEINVGAVYLYYRNSAGNWDLVKQLLPPAPIRLFGRSVAISGNTLVVVGLHQAVIYQKDQGGNDNWGLVKILNPSNGLHSESGSPAALAGDTLVIGAAGGATDIGTAYVFQKDQGGNNNWGEVKILVPSDGAIKDQFGSAVAISGNSIVVGAYYHGKAYIFERDQGGNNNWGQVKKLIPSVSGGGFGNSVAIDQDRVVVGSYFQGFLFARNQNGINNWGEVKILSTYGGPISVSISGETVAVGDPAVGSVYIHKKDQGGSNNWGVLKGLVSLTATGENFGNPIVLKNNRIGVWAPGSLILESASAYEPFFPTLYVFE